MGLAVEVTRKDLDVAQLRAEARRTSDNKQARRILAIAMALEGHPRQLAAQAGAMDRQTLRDWVHRYNADGLVGLADQPRSGRPGRLTPTQLAELAQWVTDGPDPQADGVVRWRCVDLRERIAARFEVELHERTVGKVLKKLDFSNISARPIHPQSDPEAQEAFKKTSPPLRGPRSPSGLPTGPSRSGSKTKRASASKAR